jgi:hypothetical protein
MGMRRMRDIMDEVRTMQEAAYTGNLGFVEMFKFMQSATPAQVKRMEELLAGGEYDAVWALLRKVTGVPLKKFSEKK